MAIQEAPKTTRLWVTSEEAEEREKILAKIEVLTKGTKLISYAGGEQVIQPVHIVDAFTSPWQGIQAHVDSGFAVLGISSDRNDMFGVYSPRSVEDLVSEYISRRFPQKPMHFAVLPGISEKGPIAHFHRARLQHQVGQAIYRLSGHVPLLLPDESIVRLKLPKGYPFDNMATAVVRRGPTPSITLAYGRRTR